MIPRLIALACVAFAPSLWAQDVYIYPAQNQSPEQQEKDKYDCYQFGKSQTGFDPMVAQTPTAPPPAQKGGVLKGAAGGALVGAAVGAVSGDVGKGAGYGAAAGGTIGLLRKNKSQKEQEQYQQEQQQNYQAQRSNYDRAYAACLEGRGYTVK